jgi:hypothetical protein
LRTRAVVVSVVHGGDVKRRRGRPSCESERVLRHRIPPPKKKKNRDNIMIRRKNIVNKCKEQYAIFCSPFPKTVGFLRITLARSKHKIGFTKYLFVWEVRAVLLKRKREPWVLSFHCRLLYMRSAAVERASFPFFSHLVFQSSMRTSQRKSPPASKPK